MIVGRWPFRLARRIRVFWTFFTFALYVYLDAQGWLGRKAEKREARLRRQAIRLRERLISLGPTFIKIGQMLGTRADLLPIEYVDELSALQDKVPAFPNQQATAIIEAELGRPISEVFSQIGEHPVASASLGQVYHATLLTGEEVAVKVQRPQIAELVAFDLELLRWLAQRLSRYPRLFPGTDWPGAIDEFDRVIHEEMDYRREAASAEEFRNNFRDWPDIHVPRIHREFSSGRVIVMEFIRGVKITDLSELRAAGHEPRRINELLYRAYFKQLLEDGFFHADPHPGNLLVMADGRLAIFDFGMVGRISAELQRQMIEAFFHLYNRDVPALVDDMISLGFLSPDADLVSFRAIVADVFTRKLNLKLGEVRFKELTYDLAPIVYEYPITTPAQFTYLIRAIMTLEGISVVMNPEFNFFEVARPYVQEFLFKRESSQLRRLALQSLQDARTGRFDWGRLWSMAKMAYSLYIDRA
ncbi:MAG TPA: AarF/ABC1/UbiB kinase family protein [Blastocatellia bacterium]|nr:AarF/ABC1/UbiB kinase family protein [Blastocatellia bacterium]